MYRTALVLGAVLIAAGSAAAGATAPGFYVRFLAPAPDAVMVGPTTFRFAIAPHDPPIDRVEVFFGGWLVATAVAPAFSVEADVPPHLAGSEIMAVAYAGPKLVTKARLATARSAGMSTVEVVRVPLYAVVTKANGDGVPGLGTSDFELLVDGSPMRILTCTSELPSLTLALVLDVSGSMTEKMDIVQSAAQSFVERFREQDRIALYAFNESMRRILPPTDDRPSLRAEIAALDAGGSTALHDGLLEVIEQLRHDPGRKAIFVFSDGLDEISVSSFEDVVDAARRSDASIYSVATPDPNDQTGRADLARLATLTGGRSILVQRLKDLRQAFELIAADFAPQYVITFTPPEGRDAVHRIDLRARNAEYNVRTRSEFVHTSPEPPASVPKGGLE